MTNPAKTSKTRWHRLLGTLLEYLLTPVDISVQCDIKVMVNPPEADILLLRRETTQWTEQQRLRLPDGIRNIHAQHILLEFKYSESVNESALQQTLSYDFFYKRANNLTDEQVQSFLISAKTPRPATLNKFAMQSGQFQGVYTTELPLLQHLVLIVLNELSDEPHNAWIKCFASQNKEKQKAFALLRSSGLKSASVQLEWFLSGLWEYWFTKKQENTMRNELTAEEVMEMGKFWGESYLSLLKVEDILPYFKPQEILELLTPAERLAGLKAKDRLAGLDAKERLAGLSVEEVEAYLQKIKH